MRKTYALLSIVCGGLFAISPASGQSQAGFANGAPAAPSAASSATPNAVRRSEDYDPLLDLPPLPHEKVTSRRSHEPHGVSAFRHQPEDAGPL
jgi:hypothetical protein